MFKSLSVFKKDVSASFGTRAFFWSPLFSVLAPRVAPSVSLGGSLWGLRWVVRGGLLFLSFSFCGVFSWFLLLLCLAVLFLLFLLCLGLALSWCLASAGVPLPVLFLSGSLAPRLRCRVAWVVRLLQLCRRWWPLSVLLALLVCLCPSVSVLAGPLLAGSVLWLLLLLALLRRKPFLFPPCPCPALRFRWVGFWLSSWGLGFLPPSLLVGCRCWLPLGVLPSTRVLERNSKCKT